MARPIKDGVDYFPKDTDFYQDDKVRLLRAEFGAKGMYILDYLLCEMYGKNGYFIKWDKNKCLLVSDGAGCGCSPEYISEFVAGCIRCSFFDKRVFDVFGALTSAGIQRRYIRMFNSRDEIQIIKEYWLLDCENKKDVPSSILNKVTFISIKSTENPVKSTENPVKSTENPQSKVKENKVNKSKEKSICQLVADLYNDTCVSFPKIANLSGNRKKAIKARLNSGYTEDDFKRLFLEAESSSFLKGKNSRDWQATFDWLIKDGNMAKVLDGNFKDRDKPPTKSEDEEAFDFKSFDKPSYNLTDIQANLDKYLD